MAGRDDVFEGESSPVTINYSAADRREKRMSREMSHGGGRYTPEEVKAILERAIAAQKGNDVTGISYQELQETAGELDINPHDLERAIEEFEETRGIEEARQEWMARRKEKFFEHFRSYLIVNGVLMVIALLSGSGFWFLWPLLGWGVGLAFDASEAFRPKEKDVEKGAERLLMKQDRESKLRKKSRRISFDTGTTSSHGAQTFARNIVIDAKQKKLIIEKGDRRIEIG